MVTLRSDAPRIGSAGGQLGAISVGIALLLFLAALLWNWHWNARAAMTAAAAELRSREAEWKTVSPILQKAVAERSMNEDAQREQAWVAADHAKARWTPALSELASYWGAAIEIRELVARGESDASGVEEIRITGSAGGAAPRRAADQFRSALGERIKGRVKGRIVSSRFQSLEEASTASTEPPRADFVIIVSVDSPGTESAIRKQ